MKVDTKKMLTGKQLLSELFPADSRPCGRTLARWRATGELPFVPIGRLIFYDLAQVRAALARKKRRTT